MKYSIIIPTMWFHVEQLKEMLAIYNSISSVGEIIIINNYDAKTPELKFSKVKLIGKGRNLYVNPSWKLGVQESKFDTVILANDDITLKGDIKSLFEKVSYLLKDNVIVGPNEKCYTGINFKFKLVKLPLNSKMCYGFGVFMFMRKNTFLNTSIPKDILVWHGDRILHSRNEAWCFEGIKIKTGMSGTTSKIDLSGVARKERIAYTHYLRTVAQ